MFKWSLPNLSLSKEHKVQLNGFYKKLDTALSHATALKIKKGQELFYKDHKPLGVILISKGQVVLKDKDLTIVAPKMWPLGLDWIFFEQKYPVTALAMSDVEYFFISKNNFK